MLRLLSWSFAMSLAFIVSHYCSQHFQCLLQFWKNSTFNAASAFRCTKCIDVAHYTDIKCTYILVCKQQYQQFWLSVLCLIIGLLALIIM